MALHSYAAASCPSPCSAIGRDGECVGSAKTEGNLRRLLPPTGGSGAAKVRRCNLGHLSGVNVVLKGVTRTPFCVACECVFPLEMGFFPLCSISAQQEQYRPSSFPLQ